MSTLVLPQASADAPEPYPLQLESVPILRGNRVVLADPPGLGKSRSALMAAQGRTLIVAPSSLWAMWEEQVRIYAPDLDWSFAAYTKLSDKKKVWDSELDMVVQQHSGKIRPELKQRFDTIIADEAHALKGRQTKWTLAFEDLASSCGQMSLLTGTPIPNWGHEAYMLLRLIYGKKDKRYSSYWRWVGQWFQMEQNRFSGRMSEIGDLWPHLTWDDFVAQFEGHWLSRPESALDLPPVTPVHVECKMTATQAKAYYQMKTELVADIGNEAVVSWHPGSANTILLKMSTGLETVSGTKSSGKLDAMEDLMVDRRGDPTVFFTHFRDSAEAVAARVKDCVVIHGGIEQRERDRLLADWKAGRGTHLSCTYSTMAEGQTLTRSNCTMRIEAHHRPSTMDQARRRTDRGGQIRPGFLYDFVTLGTVDVKLRKLLATKTDQQMKFYRAIDLLSD